MNNKKVVIAAKEIIHKYQSRKKRDSADAFYSWRETEILLEQYRLKQPSQVKSINAQYRLITDAKQLKELLNPLIGRCKRIGIDTETTGLDPYTNKVRLVQIAASKHPVFIIDLAAIAHCDLYPLKQLLTSNCLKIGHNLKFDLMMLTTDRLNLEPPYFDTYLAYKVLTAGLRTTSTLEVVTHKLLRVRLNKSAQTSDFSRSLSQEQLQYAANDAAVLLPLHRKLTRRLTKAKLTDTAQTEFDCLRAVAQMELNGVRLDLDKWELLKQDLLRQQAYLEQKLQANLVPCERQTNILLTKLNTKVNLSSPKQVVAAFNRLGIEVKSTNVRELIPLAQDYPVKELRSKAEGRGQEAEGDCFGEISSSLQTSPVAKIRACIGKEEETKENLLPSGGAVTRIQFESLKAPSSCLLPSKAKALVIRWLLEYRSLTTRINTFSIGLPQFIHPLTERIQGHWWQMGARSGRFSCREPNLTNIPRALSTRQCFTASPGNVIIKADYSQIELRLMAKASGDRSVGFYFVVKSPPGKFDSGGT